MTGQASVLGEAELHGLVDGHLEVDRRADVLRRLAASPADRALVEAWQDQNDLIRAAFRDVEAEALPIALDAATPRLRCIDGNLDRRLDRRLDPICAPLGVAAREEPRALSRGAIPAAVALLIVALGLSGLWLVLDRSLGARATTETVPQAGLEATLAEHAVAALDETTDATNALSSLHVPDLSAEGLRLTSASMRAGEPASMVLSYRDAGAGRVVLSVANAPDQDATPPASIGEALAWRRGGAVYALAGNLPPARLRALAQSLQDDADQE